MSKKFDILRPLIILVITSAIMVATTVTMYATIAKPSFYTQFITLGSKYLSEGKYEEAILEFEKAIKIEGKSVQARVGLAKGSIEVGKIEYAVQALEQAQLLDFDNKELLKTIIDILKDCDPEAAYRILMRYVDKYDKDNIDPDVKTLLDSAQEPPQLPTITPPPGWYVKPVTVKLTSDKVRIGHTFHYTIDETVPDKKSIQYRNGIYIEGNTNIKLIGYNQLGVATEVFDAPYVINVALFEEVSALLNSIKTEMDNTKVGTEVGNCIEGAKEELQVTLDSGNAMIGKTFITVDETVAMIDKLNKAVETFRSKIIVPTERGGLESEIKKAENLINSAVEGSAVGQYRSGAKNALNAELKKAKQEFANLIARQKDIDNAKKRLTNAISSFNAKKVTQLDKIIQDSGAKIGPVTVSLIWNTTDDMDLHVTSPRGDTIYYGNKNGSSGGRLDVDRQVSTFVANPVENIYWQNPPKGTYKVQVNPFSRRTTGAVSFQVRVIVNGEAKLYNMTATSGKVTVCTFTY